MERVGFLIDGAGESFILRSVEDFTKVFWFALFKPRIKQVYHLICYLIFKIIYLPGIMHINQHFSLHITVNVLTELAKELIDIRSLASSN